MSNIAQKLESSLSRKRKAFESIDEEKTDEEKMVKKIIKAYYKKKTNFKNK